AWGNIKAKQKRSALLVMLKRSAVAASIVGVLFMAYNHFSYNHKDSLVKTIPHKTITLAKAEHKITSNDSKKIMKVILQDNSVISLSPGAVIRYDVPFQNNRRDISLTGEALFNVAKDKTKPFTVYAGSLTTTALGTQFKITAGKKSTGNI